MSEESIIIQYKGFKIQFSQWDEVWQLIDDDSHCAYENASLKSVKQYIDKVPLKNVWSHPLLRQWFLDKYERPKLFQASKSTWWIIGQSD